VFKPNIQLCGRRISSHLRLLTTSTTTTTTTTTHMSSWKQKLSAFGKAMSDGSSGGFDVCTVEFQWLSDGDSGDVHWGIIVEEAEFSKIARLLYLNIMPSGAIQFKIIKGWVYHSAEVRYKSIGIHAVSRQARAQLVNPKYEDEVIYMASEAVKRVKEWEVGKEDESWVWQATYDIQAFIDSKDDGILFLVKKRSST
jgi:hypothetical protein